MSLKEKEDLINSSKATVINDQVDKIKIQANDIKNDMSLDDTEKQGKLEGLKNEMDTLLGAVGYDVASGLLKNNFKKTTQSEEYDNLVSQEGFLPETADAAFTFTENLLQTAGKGTIGFVADVMSGALDTTTDQKHYSTFDAFSDTVGQLMDFNIFSTSKKDDTRLVNAEGDLDINYKTVTKSLAQTLPFTLLLINDVKKGKVTNVEAKLGQLLSPQKSQKMINSLRMVDSAFRHTVSDNINMGQDLGLNDNEARAFGSVLSMAEGMSELIMPDTKFFESPAGDLLKKGFVDNLKKATTKEAISATTKKFIKDVAMELGEEEVVALTEDLTKFAMVVGHENSEFLDVQKQKELAASTIIMSGALGGYNLNSSYKGSKMDIYKAISNDVNGVKDFLETEKQDKNKTQAEIESLDKAIIYSNQLSEAITKSPENVTAEQIDLLIEKKNLLEKMKGLDDSFHPQIKEQIQVINNKINSANELKEPKNTEVTDGRTATEGAIKKGEGETTETEVQPTKKGNGVVLENFNKELPKVTQAPSEVEDGHTFNLDGTTYDKGGLVISVVSKNMTQAELTPEAIQEFIDENSDKIDGESVKVGVYKFPNSDQVSIDLNIVAPNSKRAEALEFAKQAGQESLFDLDTFENVKTGADGKNPKSFTAQEFKDIAKKFSNEQNKEGVNIEEGKTGGVKEAADNFSITDVDGDITEGSGKDQIKKVNAAAKSFFSMSDKALALRDLKDAVGSMVKRGKLTQSQSKNLIGKAVAVDPTNQAQVDKFLDYFDRQMNKAESRDIKNAVRSAKRKASKSSRAKSKKTPQNIKDLAKASREVNENYLNESELKQFNEVLDEINNAFSSATSKAYSMVNVEEAKQKLEKLYEKSQERKTKDLAKSMGVEAIDMTSQEIDEMFRSENVDEFINNLKEAKAKEARTLLEKHASYSKMALDDFNDSDLTNKEKSALKELKTADFTNMSSSMIRDYIKIIDNIATNGDFSNSSVITSFLKSEKAVAEVIKSNNKNGVNPRELNTARENWRVFGVKIPNTFNIPDHIKHLINAMTSLNVTMNIIGGGSKYGAYLYDKLGFFDISNAKVKAEVRKNKFEDNYNKMLEKLHKSDPKVLDGDQVVRRSVMSTLLQADQGSVESMNHFKEAYIKGSIEVLKKYKRNNQQSKQKIAILESILNELEGINTKEDLVDYLKTKDKSNYKILKFASDMFLRHSNEFEENSYMVHGEPFEARTEDDFYLPLMRSSLMDKSMAGKINDAREAMNFLSYKSSNPQSGSIFTRKKNARLDKGQTINFNFDQAVAHKYAEQVYDIEAAESILKVKGILSHPDFIKEFGLGTAQELQKKAIDKIAMDSGAVFTSSKEWEKNLGNIEKILRKLGSINALGGVDQFFKQYPAVVFSAGIRLGSDAFLLGKYMFTNKDNIGLLKASSIRLRKEADAGIKRASDDIRYDDLTLGEKTKVQAFTKILTKYGGLTLDKARELSMLSLRVGDVNAANTTFLSYYHSYLRKNGVKDSDIDMDTEHIKIEEGDKLRREAQAYAQHMINTTQTSSDLTEGSNFVANPNVMTRFFMGAIMPFSSHSNNAIVRMLKATKNLTLGKNKKENSAEIAASISEIAMFHSIKAFLIAPVTIYLGKALFGSDDDDSEEMVNWSFQTIKAASGTLGDISPLPDSFDIDAVNYLIYLNYKDEFDEDLSFEEYTKLMKDIKYGKSKEYDSGDEPLSFYRYGDNDGFDFIDYDDFGLYDIPIEQATKVKDAVDFIADGKLEKKNKYGKKVEYEISEENKAFLMMYTLKEMLAMIGTGDAMTRRMMEKRYKEVLEESKVE